MRKAVTKLADGPEMPSQLAALLLDVLQEEGVSRAAVLAGTGIRPVMLEREDSYLTYRQYLSLINHALALSGIPDLGLVVGSRENISTWGMLGYAVMSSATYREAFETGLKFHTAASGMMLLNARQEGDQVCLTLEAPVPLGDALPFCVEEMVAGITTVFRKLLGRSMQPTRLRLVYDEPSYAAEYGKLLNCPVEFGREANELFLPAPDDTPLPQADPVSARMCRKLVEEMLDRHGVQEDLVREVQRILLRNPGSIPDMETVAEELDVSSRGLRRELDARDTSFQAIRDELRRQLALDYLRDSSLTLEVIAERLGYTEVTNFRRAFKQWTGHPPSSFR
jgi:AraC-like DNA-binding protein